MSDTNLTNAGLLALALTVALKWAGVFSKIAELLNGGPKSDVTKTESRAGGRPVSEWEQRIDRIVETRLNTRLAPLETTIDDTNQKVNRLLAYAEMEQRRHR